MAEDAQHALPAEEQRLERRFHGVHRACAIQVDMLVDGRWHLGHDQQTRGALVANGDRLGAERHQHLVLRGARQAVGAAFDQHDRHRGRRAQRPSSQRTRKLQEEGDGGDLPKSMK